MAKFTMTIGGWSTRADEHFDVINPATGGLAGRCPSGGEAEVNAAVAAAKVAFEDWSAQPDEVRRQACRDMAGTNEFHGCKRKPPDQLSANSLILSMVSKALMELCGRPWMLIGAVERTRTSTGCPTATSTLRVYQFRHDRKKSHVWRIRSPTLMLRARTAKRVGKH
jgi:hypothetical protein